MAAPISDEIAQKIFKAMEEQSDVLKRMGSRLTKLEEAKKLKKPKIEEAKPTSRGSWWRSGRMEWKGQSWLWEK